MPPVPRPRLVATWRAVDEPEVDPPPGEMDGEAFAVWRAGMTCHCTPQIAVTFQSQQSADDGTSPSLGEGTSFADCYVRVLLPR